MLVVTTYIYTSCYRNINFIITKSVFSNHKRNLSNHKLSREKWKSSTISKILGTDSQTVPLRKIWGSGGITFRWSEAGWRNGASRQQKIRKTFFFVETVLWTRQKNPEQISMKKTRKYSNFSWLYYHKRIFLIPQTQTRTTTKSCLYGFRIEKHRVCGVFPCSV